MIESKILYITLNYFFLFLTNNIIKINIFYYSLYNLIYSFLIFLNTTALFIFLKYHLNIRCLNLIDLITIHFIIYNRTRFMNIYNLISYKFYNRFFIKNILFESFFISISYIYTNINWYERESFDLYGIIYSGNIDLRRILNDYGFKGHPMLKDFPLSGFLEIQYNFYKKILKYKQINLIQLYRFFNISNIWTTIS